jgi:lipopolysaccharide/colanic/teichoic acid biosynthesis glycosyltransferase
MVNPTGERSKRVLDMILGSAAAAVSLPVGLVIAACIRKTMGGPVLFRQVRPGLGGRPFTMVKFRTMNDARNEKGDLLPDGDRITRLGRFLRHSSLDELPELYNVLRGDMSLVGPRPLLVRYLDRYTREQARRHDVRPGITGWTQVNGRNALSWEDKFALDVWYVDHRSLGLDLRILGMTVWKVLKREGIARPGSATTEEFMGNQQ